MIRSIAEWQKAAFALAREKGFHSRECTQHTQGAAGSVHIALCDKCGGTGFIEVDHKSPTRIASCLALIHCEISEAVECAVRGEMDWYYCDPIAGCYGECGHPPGQEKPEGFPIELADVFLRLCDLAESLGIALERRGRGTRAAIARDPEVLLARLCEMHRCVSLALEAPPIGTGEHQDDLCFILDVLCNIAEECDVDLLTMAELKHEYNKTRPYKHGKLL